MSASEQTSASKREPGWYWVRTQRDRSWIVRRFNAHGFWYDPYRNDVTDDEWPEIYEYRLPEPFAVGQPDELSKAQQRIKELEEACDHALWSGAIRFASNALDASIKERLEKVLNKKII